jgi:SAM-dependent methyltransferase
VLENQMGPSALWLTEWVCERMDLRAGMRVLDMGCGRALSSVFLAKEFGVEVWANDLWIKPGDNWARIRDAGLEDRIFPIHAEARSLPYAEEFFDAIVSVDSYHYYGTDDCYLGYFIKFLKHSGQIGIAVPGLVRDFGGTVPEHLDRRQRSGSTFWAEDCWSFHTVEWWRHLWNRSKLVEVEHADLLAEGWRMWLEWEKTIVAAGANQFPADDEALEADQGRYLGFVRMVARRMPRLEESKDEPE